MVVGKVAGVQDLKAGIVLTVEGRHCRGTACRLRGFRRAEPEAKMVHLYRVKWGVQAGIRKWSIENNRGRRTARRHGERLDTEPANEHLMAAPVFIGLDVALIPGDAKRRLGDLDDKQIELRFGRQSLHGDVHKLDWSH